MAPSVSAHLETARAREARSDWPGAVAAYDAALAAAPNLAEAHFNRANLLRRAGQRDEALAGYDRAVALRPEWGAAHLNRGAALADAGSTGAAIACFRAATRLEPDNALAWGNLGNALSRLGRHAQAIAALLTATRLNPDGAIAHFNLGNAYTAAGRRAEAAEALLKAVTLAPTLAAAAINLSSRLRELGAPEAALQAAQQATQTAPALPQAWCALGNAHYDLGDFAAAETCHRRAVSLDPHAAPGLANLALMLAALGDPAGALQCYETAMAIDPAYPPAQFGRATTLLACGDFARGWPAFAARKNMPDARSRRFAQKLWQGGAVQQECGRGATILVHAEQGLGDTLQFIRFAPHVAQNAGARVILEVQPPLVRLLGCLPGIARIIPAGARIPRFDLHCPLLDLPAIFAPSIASLAPAHPYLMADATLLAQRRLPAADGALRIGLVWAGQSRPEQPHAFAMDRRRSLRLDHFAGLAPLCRAGRIQLFGLQMGPQAGQIEHPPEGLAVTDALVGVIDFAETAAVVAQLDLVIAVDTSTAHLAGAMGKPVWLLSRFDACWRWLHGRDDCPWYPSMRIFRQAVPGDWAGVINGVVRQLEEGRLLF